MFNTKKFSCKEIKDNICKENPSSENLQSLYNNLTQNIKDTCAKVFPEEENDDFLTQFSKKHLPCRDYTGKMTQINSTQEAHIWTNQA